MRHHEHAASTLSIPHPDCPKCGGRMWLARIEPEEPGYDRRTFECPECDHSLVQVVKYK